MATVLPTLEFPTSQQWRRWLESHHHASRGVWVVFFKGRAAATSMAYEDAVRDALCYGWIDSLVKRLDEERYARKFTPRKADSAWSDSNRRRWAELEAAGLLAPAGRAGAPTDTSSAPPPIPELPEDLGRALEQHEDARRAFEALAPSHRRHYVAWIHTARRAETREKRLREAIAMLTTGKTLGLE